MAAKDFESGQPPTAVEEVDAADGSTLATLDSPRVISQAEIDAGKIVSTIYDWVGAWASRDLDRYLAFYSPDFRPSRGRDRRAWEKARRRVIGQARGIRIALEKLDVQVEGDNATARFVQHYQSANYRDTTMKELRFQRQDGRWLIVAESNR